MLTKTIGLNDFHFELLVRVEARNCRQLAIRLLAAVDALAAIGSKIAAYWLAASSS